MTPDPFDQAERDDYMPAPEPSRAVAVLCIIGASLCCVVLLALGVMG